LLLAREGDDRQRLKGRTPVRADDVPAGLARDPGLPAPIPCRLVVRKKAACIALVADGDQDRDYLGYWKTRWQCQAPSRARRHSEGV
jgi:hypothetical protein